jgi:iron complex transport system substrate-binding protein
MQIWWNQMRKLPIGIQTSKETNRNMFPERIICLSAESADICDRLGAADRVAAVSAFAPRSMRVGRAVVGGFSTLKMEDVLSIEPDLVITFSDVQAQISADLIRNHYTVLATNQRSLRGIVEAILLIGRAIGCSNQAEKLASDFEGQLRDLRRDQEPRPRVYFEEWDEPLITGIGWVSEAIKLVGGDETIFSRPGAKSARERQVESSAVCGANPQIIFASWCGKPVDLRQITTRPGWDVISAVKSGEIYEIDSADILQPGPRVLEGVKKISAIIEKWQRKSNR